MPAPPPELIRAFRLIEGAGGRVRIGRVAAHVGWSRRTLSARFGATLGMPPKTGARIEEGLTDQPYCSREFICRDPEGNVWCFGTYWPTAPGPH